VKIQEKLVVTLMAVTFLIGVAGSVAIYEVNRIAQPLGTLPDSIELLNEAAYLDGLARLIHYYDEVLTQSARNYAFTQDKTWEERYQSTEPELDRVIKDAIAKGDETDVQFFSSVDKANIALVEMEYQAIELTNAGQPEQAIEILESEQYFEQKRIYDQALRDYVTRRGAAYDDALRISTDSLLGATEDIQGEVGQTTQLIIVAVPVIIVSAAIIGFIIFYSITRPLHGLRHAATEIAKGNFDVKIDLTRNDEIGELALHFENMREELKRKERLKDEFISVASHELRSPIQPIMGFIDLAKKGYVKPEEAIDGILPQARRLQQLANDILDVTRIEGDSLRCIMEKVRISEVVSEVVEAAKVNLDGSVSIETKVVNGAQAIEIDADKARVVQVLSNLVSNAVKFTKMGTIRVETRASVERNFVEIRVSDTGGGIPEEVLQNLFGKFVTKSVGKDNQHGTGLGLFISKAIVTAHNGIISGSNNKDGGATFVVMLPIFKDEKMYA
jgi:signal transduction histidine kinase